MNVRVERDGPVTTVILDRPAVRNAVDGPTAAALAGAFRAFDVDDGARVAVLWGAGGTFCAGTDLKAVGGPDGNRAEPGIAAGVDRFRGAAGRGGASGQLTPSLAPGSLP
jgi:enoyl-CoA hydratase